MRIVHYTLGIFPNRAGGLNRYATNLMVEQAKEHEVTVVIPGGWIPWRNHMTLKEKGMKGNLRCFHLCNALPLPLLYGIKKPQEFTSRGINRKNFENFYDNVRPTVLHLHTLMGISEEFLRFFRSKGVKIVYTSHDYYGICPKVNLINQNGVLCEGPSPERCAICNVNSPSILFLRLRNSEMLLKLRDFIRWLKNTLHF